MPILSCDDFSKNRLDIQKVPILLKAGMLMKEASWEGPEHLLRHFSELVYIVEGQGSVKIGTETYSVGRAIS